MIEDAPYAVLTGLTDDLRQPFGRRFLAVGFDRHLPDAVIPCVIGEGGVVDDEVFDAALRDLLAGAGVQRP